MQVAQKAGVDGRLFGSVTNADIVEALKTQGFDVRKRQVRMPNGPLKHVGEHPMTLRLHTDVVAQIKVVGRGGAVNARTQDRIRYTEKRAGDSPFSFDAMALCELRVVTFGCPSTDEIARRGSSVSQIVQDTQLDARKLPPHSLEAEQSVLGGLLLDNAAWDRIADLVSESDFYRADHRSDLSSTSRALIEHNKPADVVTVAESLEGTKELADVGGLAYLGALAQQHAFSAANIRRYAEIVRERSILRQLAEVGTEIADSAYNPMGKEANTLLDEAEAKVFEIAEQGARGKQGFQEMPPLLTKVVERIDMLYNRENDSDVTGVPTGFVDLDRMTSGLAARRSHHRRRPSVDGQDDARSEHCGARALSVRRLPCGVFSMEMAATQLAMRMIGSVGKLDQHKLRTGTLQGRRLAAADGRGRQAERRADPHRRDAGAQSCSSCARARAACIASTEGSRSSSSTICSSCRARPAAATRTARPRSPRSRAR